MLCVSLGYVGNILVANFFRRKSHSICVLYYSVECTEIFSCLFAKHLGFIARIKLSC